LGIFVLIGVEEMASEARVVELLGSVLAISSALYIVAIIKKKDSVR